MDEQAKLQHRIAQLEAQVDRAKRAQAQTHQVPHRGRPYTHYGGRWAPYGQPHRNLSLIVNDVNVSTVTPPTPDKSMIKPVGKSHQLVNQKTLNREQQQEQELMEKLLNKKERERPKKSVTATAHTPPQQTGRIMEVDGIAFRLSDDGSKLTRPRGMSLRTLDHGLRLSAADHDAQKQTPKKATIAGVTFLRTKHGNLLRAAPTTNPARYHPFHSSRSHCRSDLLVSRSSRKQKPQCENFTKDGTRPTPTPTPAFPMRRSARRRRWRVGKPSPLTDFHPGKCPWGHNCKFSHDPEKVAVCKDFLRTGTCPQGSSCDFSHELTYHRVSACTHFLRGNCTNDACRYPHVSVSPAAKVCRAFATLGYCAKGAKCSQRHVVECPDYADTGRCANHELGKCKLPHVERANALRKAARRQAKKGSADESDLSSEEEPDEEVSAEEISAEDDSDGVESDIEGMFDDLLTGGTVPTSAFTKQQDYVRIG